MWSSPAAAVVLPRGRLPLQRSKPGRRPQGARNGGVLGERPGQALIIAVLTSASASTQTTILPTARTTLVDGALESGHRPARPRTQALSDPHRLDARLRRALDRLHGRPAAALRKRARRLDSSAIGFPICFYYGFTGVACGWYYRHDLMEERAQLPATGPRPAARRADAVRHRRLRRPSTTATPKTSNQSRSSASRCRCGWASAACSSACHHAHLAPVLQRVLLTQDRNGAPRPARAASADWARTGPGRLLSGDRAYGAGNSICPCGEPYSASKSRNGLGGNASGPSTPTPRHSPRSSSSSATTGLIAVCQTTA